MVLRNETIDDRQTDIHYQGSWGKSVFRATSTGESGTLSFSNSPVANFTVDTPPILGFYYFGLGRSKGGFYQICIDCDPNNRVWEDIDGLNRTDDGHNPPAALYSKHWGNAGSHEIIITNREDTRFANGGSQITLDRLVYTIDDGSDTVPNPPGPTVTTSTDPVQTSASNTPNTLVKNSQSASSQTSINGSSINGSSINGSSRPQSIGSHTTSNTQSSIGSGDGGTGTGVPTSTISGGGSLPEATVTATETNKTIGSGSIGNVPVAAIAGGVVGGILLILVGVFFLLWRRRRMRGQKTEDGDGDGELSSSSDPNTGTTTGDSLLVGVPPVPSVHSSLFVTGSGLVSPNGGRSQIIHGSGGSITSEGWIAVRREDDGGSIHGLGMSEFGGEDGKTLPPDYCDIARHNG